LSGSVVAAGFAEGVPVLPTALGDSARRIGEALKNHG
jgi:hypothetical protein